MTRVIALPSRIEDVYALAKTMRARDAEEARIGFGADPKALLRDCFKQSILRQTYFVGDEIAAMVGMAGPLIGEIGYPYLITSPAIARAPLAAVREARKAVARMLQIREILVAMAPADWPDSLRFLEMVGFIFDEPEPMGKNQMMFRRCTMQRAA